MKLLNLIPLLFLPLLFTGIINKTKAFWCGRRGASVFQPFSQFLKLLRKGEVISPVTSWVFCFFPWLFLAATLFAGILLPLVNHKALFSFEGSFILFIYLLALGKFFTVLGAMDTGSSFEGMGAAREVFFTSIPEPAFFIILASLSVFQQNPSFEDIFNLSPMESQLSFLITLLILIVFFVILLVESSRIPIDDPNTHLELTMIHEVMILDNSGPSLAAILFGSAMKMVLIGSLILNFMIPENIGTLSYLCFYSAGMLVMAFFIGTIEALVARLRIVRVPDFIFSIVGLALMVMFIVLLYYYRGNR